MVNQIPSKYVYQLFRSGNTFSQFQLQDAGQLWLFMIHALDLELIIVIVKASLISSNLSNVQPRSEPALDLNSRAASSVGVMYCSNNPNTKSNSGGRWKPRKKNLSPWLQFIPRGQSFSIFFSSWNPLWVKNYQGINLIILNFRLRQAKKFCCKWIRGIIPPTRKVSREDYLDLFKH